MRLDGAWIAVVGFVAVLALAPAAGAQVQEIAASVDGEVTGQPDELPGTYEAELLVTVEAAGGQCVCHETEVTVQASSVDAEAIALEPETYAIDWTSHQGTHEQPVTATIDVGQLAGDGQARIGVELDHQPESAHLGDETEPVTLTLEAPASSGGEAAPQSSEDGGEDGTEGVPAPGVAPLVAAATGAAAVGRRRP